MLVALLLFLGYIRVLYYIFYQAKGKLLIWRVALFSLSFFPLLSSFYFFDKESTIVAINEYKLYLRVFFLLALSVFMYADWKMAKVSRNEKRKRNVIKESLILCLAIIIYYFLSM